MLEIRNNTVVKCHYSLREGSAGGELIESTEGAAPLTYIQGVGDMIPPFEQNMTGKKAGDDFSFFIKSEDAYGNYDDTKVQDIPYAAFKLDEGTNVRDIFEPGTFIPLKDENGEETFVTVIDAMPEAVRLDFNHPMAGVDLYFSVRVTDVRAATQDEVAHGHVHGGDDGIIH